jgi:hypothetical protein
MKFYMFLAAIAVLSASVARAESINLATGPIAPSFRGAANTTYFGWTNGTWDGNPPANPGDPDVTPDVIAGTPPVNPGGLAGPLLAQNNSADIVSSSNNIYTSPANVDLTLTIPTVGTIGTGFTTIIVQGNGLGGFGGITDLFTFGDIEGVAPTYVHGANADNQEAQFWAKWEIPGNAASYSVNVAGSTFGAGVVSISDMTVDALWSPSGYAPDAVAAVPEPASFALVGAALTAATVLVRHRR